MSVSVKSHLNVIMIQKEKMIFLYFRLCCGKRKAVCQLHDFLPITSESNRQVCLTQHSNFFFTLNGIHWYFKSNPMCHTNKHPVNVSVLTMFVKRKKIRFIVKTMLMVWNKRGETKKSLFFFSFVQKHLVSVERVYILCAKITKSHGEIIWKDQVKICDSWLEKNEFWNHVENITLKNRNVSCVNWVTCEVHVTML